MTATRIAFRQTLALGSLFVSLSVLSQGCSLFSGGPRHLEEIRTPETAVPKTPLPTPSGILHKLDFDDPPDGALVKPKDRGELAILNTEVATGLMVTPAADLKELALANTKVRELLGARFTLISTRDIDPGNKQSLGCCATAPSKARLTFYSYTNNVTVDVEMKGEAITGLSRRESYLPPEGEEELQDAIALARKDDRIVSGLEGLDGHAILMQPGDGVLWNEPGYGHRVFWVTFSKGLSGNPEYWAVVDLSEQKVLKAEKEATHP